jgi:EAL domain-containing protein (putative c-di-GMP-specific phosphodiesterase class I)
MMRAAKLRRTVATRGSTAPGDWINHHFAVLAVGVLALGLAGLVTVAHVLVSSQLRASKEQAATNVAVVLARSAFEPAVAADSDHLDRTEIARLDAAANGAHTTQTLLGLTMFAPNGRVLYSPNHRLIGAEEALGSGDRAAMSGRVTITPPHPGTGVTDTSSATQIDVDVPLLDARGSVAAEFELGVPYAPIAAAVAAETLRVDLALAAVGLVILLLVGLRMRRAGAALRVVAMREHTALARDLARAIHEDQLRLEYQPLAHLRTGNVRAVEALLRWEHPQRGLVPPTQFIPQAEQTSIIWPLTEHVLELAIEQAAAWRRDGLDLRVSVNIPAPCLLDDRFPPALTRILEGAGLPADRIAIEITEESAILEPEAAVAALLELRSRGIQAIAIDDFGTGYSSLTRLRDLPITGLKIDRSFVTDAAANGDNALIAAIADIAHQFGIAVVKRGHGPPRWTLRGTLTARLKAT